MPAHEPVWPPPTTVTAPCPPSISRDRVYPDYPMIFYHEPSQRLVEAVSKFGASHALWAAVSLRLAAHGELVVRDAVHVTRDDALPVDELRILTDSRAEYGYRDRERAAAVARHNRLTDLEVGRLLRVNGADGYGWYAITRRHARSVDVEYKCFGGDGWTDRFISARSCRKIPLAYARTLLYRGTV